jgi:hypothetical protein
MAHFYGFIQGNRGDATRMGSKESGFTAWAQGWGSRIAANFGVNYHTDVDEASVTIGTGPSNYSGGALRLDFPDIDAVVTALGTGDPKINRIRERIYAEIDKLNAEAPKALKRKERERKRREREMAASYAND